MNSEENSINILALGDIFLGGSLECAWHKDAYYNPFSNLNRLIETSDVRIACFEYSCFRGPLRKRRGTHLFAPKDSIHALKKIKLDVVSMANNHTMDYGTFAMLKTRRFLNSNGIETLGAGINKGDASRCIIVERNNFKIGFLAFTSNKFHVNAIEASSISSGCAPMNSGWMLKKVNELRPMVDVLVVMLHWGFEFIHVPNDAQRKTANVLIQNGVDIILGTHPHVVQSFESINGRPVFYSLGNFIFPEFEKLNGEMYTWKNENYYSIAPLIEVKKMEDGKLSFNFKIISLKFSGTEVFILTGDEKLTFENKLNLWNKALEGDRDPEVADLIKDTMNAYRKRYMEWRKSLPKRLIRKSIYPILDWILPQNYSDYIRLKKKYGELD